VCLAEGLPPNVNYRIWLRGKNIQYVSDWTQVYEVKTGQGFPEHMEGTYFSRWPASANGGASYYMDGYQVGKVRDMHRDFPFNKTKFADPKYYVGLPGFLTDSGVTRDLPGGAPYDDDDQYVLHHFGGFMGIVRAVLQNQSYPVPGQEMDYTVIETFGIAAQAAKPFMLVKFSYWLSSNKDLRGVNTAGPMAETRLTPAVLKSISNRVWDANVAYTCIRLGYVGNKDGATGPDQDADFHPQLLRPEPLAVYIQEKLGLSSSEAMNFVSSNANRWNEAYFPLEDLWDMVNW
jgi:hypothetical protein